MIRRVHTDSRRCETVAAASLLFLQLILSIPLLLLLLELFLEAPIIPTIPLIIPNHSLSYPQQVCQFLVVVWCTFYVLNCPDGVQARKSRSKSRSQIISDSQIIPDKYPKIGQIIPDFWYLSELQFFVGFDVN